MIKTKVNLRLFFDQCVLCNNRTSLSHRFCQYCLKDLPWLGNHCQKCALPLKTASSVINICAQCLLHPPSFNRVQALFTYQYPLSRLINLIKHHNKPQYLGHIAQLAAQHFTPPETKCVLIPVPMHPHCQRKRGFNQAELLCNELGKQMNLPIEKNLLLKLTKTPTQQTLSRQKRLSNLRDSFSCQTTELRSVILIDDVMTTGATAEATSRILRAAGVENIEIWVIARTAD